MSHHALASLTLAALAVAALPAAAGASPGDRDGDRMTDRWERRHHVTSPRRDHDRDRLSNLTEFRARTDPRDADSDGDGRRDGREDADRDGLTNAQEDRFGHHPRDRDDDDDGVRDGDENAGTIVSFTDGVLTIRLANGDEFAGRVDARTEIECEDRDDDDRGPTASAAHDGGDSSGPGSAEDQAAASTPTTPPPTGTPTQPSRDDDDDERCGTDQLTAGRVVHEAELELTSTGARFDEVELLR